MMGKIGELLSDEESVRQLSELAQMFMSDSASAEENNESVNAEGNQQEGNGFDISSIIKLTGLLGSAGQSDKNTELLMALRPHLKAEKQKRVDKAVKLLKLIAVWNIAKDSGLLNDMI